MPQPNWYIDPLDPSRGRYWDGARWGDEAHVIPPGQTLPAFMPVAAPPPPSPWGAPPAWGAPALPPPSAVPAQLLPPPPPAIQPDAYLAYSRYQSRQSGPNVTLLVTGIMSFLIGLLLVVWDVTDHFGPISIIIGGLIATRGAFWIVRSMRR